LTQQEIPKNNSKNICDCAMTCYFETMTNENPRLLVGYARISSEDQDIDPEIDALLKYGVERDRIFTDQLNSKGSSGRSGFRKAIKAMRPDASLVVWKMDRLGMNLSEMIQTADLLRERGMQLVSLQEEIDTVTSSGKHVFYAIGVIAQCERDMISERKKAGLAARRASGKTLGRKSILVPGSATWSEVVKLVRAGLSFVEISERINDVSKSTLYNYAGDLRAEAAALDVAELEQSSSRGDSSDE
jgi:DNA invertase Pin-like site-specific DNA recombinase